MQPPCTGLANLPRYVHTHHHHELRFYVLMALFSDGGKAQRRERFACCYAIKRVLNAEGPGAIILLQVQMRFAIRRSLLSCWGKRVWAVSTVAEGKVASVSFGYVSDACGLATRKLFKRFLEEL